MISIFVRYAVLRRVPLTLVALLLLGGQTNACPDTVRTQEPIELEAVQVQAFFGRQPLLRTTAAAALVEVHRLRNQMETSLVHVLNTVPGVQMEERSPGSYRLSIRGSLLRSPFGVRNVKIYMDDIPLTDAGGNTYLNLLDPGAISRMEILKGPDGSLFGANSGGVLILHSPDPAPLAVHLQGGSYGLFHQQFGAGFRISDQYHFILRQSFQRSDGYRDHAALQRQYLQTTHYWNYRREKPNQIRLLALYGDLDYQTPGGLTRAQYLEAPQRSRPATANVPGAREQQAGIRNKTGIFGLTHEWSPRPGLNHVASLFGSYVNFHNPFITNYEKRVERNLGLRTYLAYRLPVRSADWSIGMQTGTEWQQGDYEIRNFDNEAGQPGAVQAADRIQVLAGTSFLRFEADFQRQWLFEAALSHNAYGNRFETIDQAVEHPGTLSPSYKLPSEWMPRLAVSYRPFTVLAWRAVLSKGFSPPTTAEIRPSDNIVNTSLKAEAGWNIESGLRVSTPAQVFFGDLSFFRYRLRDALVRGSRENGAEYFHNAGRIGQFGFELAVNLRIIGRDGVDSEARRFPGLGWSGSWAWSDFRFLDYQVNAEDFSGNALTGVPRHTLMNAIYLQTRDQWEFQMKHQFVDATPLNDANSIFAESYHLLQARISSTWAINSGASASVFICADNLLNERYSLGNDINAFGGRYFNAAPRRNGAAGISLRF